MLCRLCHTRGASKSVLCALARSIISMQEFMLMHLSNVRVKHEHDRYPGMLKCDSQPAEPDLLSEDLHVICRREIRSESDFVVSGHDIS